MKFRHVLFGCLSVIVAVIVSAQDGGAIYRWKDANGTINYGVDPPPGVKAVPIGGRGTVSSVPPPAALTPDALEARREREHERQVTRLKSQIEKEQRIRQSLEARMEVRRACEEEHQTPCDEAGNPLEPTYRNIVRRPYWEYGSSTWYPPYMRPPHIGTHPPGKPHLPGARPPHRPHPGIRPPISRPSPGTRPPYRGQGKQAGSGAPRSSRIVQPAPGPGGVGISIY